MDMERGQDIKKQGGFRDRNAEAIALHPLREGAVFNLGTRSSAQGGQLLNLQSSTLSSYLQTTSNGRLLRFTAEEWRAMARDAEYNVRKLARLCGISARSLQRHFPELIGQCPQCWLDAERMRLAGELLAKGFGVLETRNELAFKSAAHFSRLFKQHYGYPPREHAARVRNSAGTPDCRQ